MIDIEHPYQTGLLELHKLCWHKRSNQEETWLTNWASFHILWRNQWRNATLYHPAFLITRAATFAKSLMLVACLVCITCSTALDVSNFRLTGNSLCGHPACSLRRWGCSGEGAPAPVNYQLINSGSFLLVLVSACKRLLVCGIGGRHCDYGIRKKIQPYFLSLGLIYSTQFSVRRPFMEIIFVIWFSAGWIWCNIVFANSFFSFEQCRSVCSGVSLNVVFQEWL